MDEVVARFAPSPTGFLHIGGIRTALINYIFVEQSKTKSPNSKLLLRIEDTDKVRSKNQYKESIIGGLNWLGIKWHGEIYLQSQRIERHKEIAYELLKKNKAFKCICSKIQLDSKRLENQKKSLNIKRLCTSCEKSKNIQQLQKDYCIRIKVPMNGKLTINDKIQGNVNTKNKEIDNFILLRNNGTPTYMLSVVVDDFDMGVNTIIRGDDHLNNTFRQLHIYQHLNWKIPQYAHLPLIHGADGSKLSKRHGAVDINHLKNIGYLPQSIINSLILLGWSPKKNNEIIEMKEIINIFNIEKISKSSSIFNYEKLNHFNNYYLKENENYHHFEIYAKNNLTLKTFIKEDNIKFSKIFHAYKKNINKFDEMEDLVKIYFDKSFKTFQNAILNEEFNSLLKKFIISLKNITEWKIGNIETCINKFIENNGIKYSFFGKPLRLILTNSKNGPSIADILIILGKKNTFLRLNNYINDRA